MLKRTLNILRTVCLLLTVLAFVTYHVWQNHPQTVVHGELRIRAHHFKEPRELRRAIEAALEAGDRDALFARAADLENATEGALPGDRLDSHRVQALTILIDEHERRGQPEDALRYSEALHAFNPRIVANELTLARLMTAAGRELESLAILDKVKAAAGDSKAVQSATLEALAIAGDSDALFATIEAQGENGALFPPLDGYQLRIRGESRGSWDVTSDPIMTAEPEFGIFAFEYTSDEPHQTLQVRCDLPSGSRAVVSSPRVTVEGEGSPSSFDQLKHTNQMTRVESSLIATGEGDPYFLLQAESALATKRTKLSFRMTMPLSQPLAKFLRTPEGAAALERARTERAPWVAQLIDQLLHENNR